MDFGKILEQWDKRPKGSSDASPSRGAGASRESVDMESLLERYPPEQDTGRSARDRDPEDAVRRRSEHEKMRSREPQAQLDLHGLTTAEAVEVLERFLLDARARGLGKVLIIHGKGNHSQGQPVLQAAVRAYLERTPLAGAFGLAERRLGGGGATWVIVRSGNRDER
jgi:DNA-nicking Smr family endonuclease